MGSTPRRPIETDLERIERRLLRLRTKFSRLAKSRDRGRSWQLFVVIFPVCLTLVGGLIVERRLASVSAEFQAGAQRREVLLRLAETLYLERLKVYVTVDQALLNVDRRVREGRFYGADSLGQHRLGLNDATIKLREVYEGERLHLTPSLIEFLDDVVRSTNSASQVDRMTPAHLDRFLKSVQAARTQMTADLRPDAVSVNPLYSPKTESPPSDSTSGFAP